MTELKQTVKPIKDIDHILGDDLLNQARNIIRPDFDIYSQYKSHHGEEKQYDILDLIRFCGLFAMWDIMPIFSNSKICQLESVDIGIVDQHVFLTATAKLEALLETYAKDKSDIIKKEIYKEAIEDTDNQTLMPSLNEILEAYIQTQSVPFTGMLLLVLKMMSITTHVKECIDKKQIVVIPFSFAIQFEDEFFSHQQMIIIRNINDKKEIIKIEPYGNRTDPIQKIIIKTLQSRFKELLDEGYVYVDNIFDELGPQSYEGAEQCSVTQKQQYTQKSYFPAKGLCLIWSVYIILLFLLNVDEPANVIGNYLTFKDVSVVDKTILFEKKSLATFLLLSWSLIRNKPKGSSGEVERCLNLGFKVYDNYKTYYAKLEPVYKKIDEIMTGLKKSKKQVGSGYYHKYIKYKLKYLRLKQRMLF